jgi:hypothetical protein
VAVGLILLLGTALRCLYVRAPLLDAHRWRQIDTATIARYFHEDSFNLLYPQVNWGGRRASAETEFPLMPAVVALFYKAFGADDRLGRLVAIVFSVATIVVVYVLASRLLDPAAGRAAALLVAVSPSAVYFGRTFMPEAPMLFFAVTGVLGFVAYAQTGNRRALWWGALATALAWLVKLPAVLTVAPIFAAMWCARREALLKDRRFVLAIASALAVTGLWYAHAFNLFRESGLTFGIWHATKTYPPEIAVEPWPALSKWSTAEILTSWSFYEELLARTFFLHLTPVGFAVAGRGILTWRRSEWRTVADAWLLAMLAFILVVGEGNRGHDYYQLPLVPVAGLYFGRAAAPLFDPRWIRTHVSAGVRGLLGLGILLVGVGLLSFRLSGVVRTHFRPDGLDVRMEQAGQAIAQAVDGRDLLIAVEYGPNSPILLYYAHMRGWSFDVSTISTATVKNLERKGARYFATTEWSELQRAQPDLVAYLHEHKTIALTSAPPETVLIDLFRAAEAQ